MPKPKSKKAKKRPAPGPLMKRKNMYMDQRKLDRAKVALGVDSETATVDAALDLVVFREEIFEGIDRLAAAGGLDYFDPADRPTR